MVTCRNYYVCSQKAGDLHAYRPSKHSRNIKHGPQGKTKYLVPFAPPGSLFYRLITRHDVWCMDYFDSLPATRTFSSFGCIIVHVADNLLAAIAGRGKLVEALPWFLALEER